MSQTQTLAEFFENSGCNQMWFSSIGQPTGCDVSRESPDDDSVFESITTNPDFWDLRGQIDELGRWECIGDDLQHCCDYLGNSLTRLVAIPEHRQAGE